MRVGWIIVGILSASLNGVPISAEETYWTIYLRQAGPLRIGMSITEARQALHDEKAFLAYGEGPEPDNCECAYLETDKKPKDLGLMFQNGRLVRMDVYERGIRTASGAQVGDSEERIKKLYPGHITVEPHHYIPESGHYLNYTPGDKNNRNYGMVFETDNGVVTSFRAGTIEAIALVEGCS
jgi:hypothetical protein